MSQPGHVIVLNGPSSVGKSDIQREIQDSFEQPYLVMGIDDLMLRMVADRYFRRPYGRDVLWIEGSKDLSGAPLHSVRFGPKGRRIVSGLHHAVAAFALRGNNVVMDYLAFEKDFLVDLTAALHGLPAYLIGLRAPLAILESREQQRSDRPRGTARAHFDIAHEYANYDLELDTSVRSTKECVDVIREYVAEEPNPSAFRRLGEHFRMSPATPVICDQGTTESSVRSGSFSRAL